jgi:hypothetical protein
VMVMKTTTIHRKPVVAEIRVFLFLRRAIRDLYPCFPGVQPVTRVAALDSVALTQLASCSAKPRAYFGV